RVLPARAAVGRSPGAGSRGRALLAVLVAAGTRRTRRRPPATGLPNSVGIQSRTFPWTALSRVPALTRPRRRRRGGRASSPGPAVRRGRRARPRDEPGYIAASNVGATSFLRLITPGSSIWLSWQGLPKARATLAQPPDDQRGGRADRIESGRDRNTGLDRADVVVIQDLDDLRLLDARHTLRLLGVVDEQHAPAGRSHEIRPCDQAHWTALR